MHVKGLLALDIDGTLTDDTQYIPGGMLEYLQGLAAEGFLISLITGRFFPFAKAHLSNLPFPWFLATQNGAQIFRVENDKYESLAHYFLSKPMVLEIDKNAQAFAEDFIVYSDAEAGYKAFYREGKFTPQTLCHILGMRSAAYHPYEKLDSFNDLPVAQVPCVKNFGTFEQLNPLHEELKKFAVHQTLIQDPTRSGYCMNLITHPRASKGTAIDNILEVLGENLAVIAAGNDRNDIDLLQRADVGIAVGPAPEALKQVARLLAPSPGLGLIPFLKEARDILGL